MEMLAWCGAALSCLLSVPQAIRVLRTERLDGISASTYVIVLGNAAVWAAWAMCTGEHAAGVPALINGPAAILILRRLAIERRTSRNPDAAAASHAPASPLVGGTAPSIASDKWPDDSRIQPNVPDQARSIPIGRLGSWSPAATPPRRSPHTPPTASSGASGALRHGKHRRAANHPHLRR